MARAIPTRLSLKNSKDIATKSERSENAKLKIIKINRRKFQEFTKRQALKT